MSVKYPKRTLKKNLNREKLAIAAVITFSRNGYPNTPLQEVADHAGVHVQTLYKQFKNKEELAIAAAELATCLLYTSPSPRDATLSRMPSSA